MLYDDARVGLHVRLTTTEGENLPEKANHFVIATRKEHRCRPEHVIVRPWGMRQGFELHVSTLEPLDEFDLPDTATKVDLQAV